MTCDVCGVAFGGTGNCDCTTDGKPNIGFWRRMARMRPDLAPKTTQAIRQAELELMKLDNRCDICRMPIVYPLRRHTLCDEAEQKREAIAYKQMADRYAAEYQITYDAETMPPKYSLPPEFDDRATGYGLIACKHCGVLRERGTKCDHSRCTCKDHSAVRVEKKRAERAPVPFKRYAFEEDV